jgi:Tfp pilus assembly protein PilF
LRTFFLFYLLNTLLGSPWLALVVVLAFVYLADARIEGRWFDPRRLFRNRQAVAELRRVISLNEHDVSAHNDLGRMLAQKGKFAEALPHMERAVRRMGEAPETHYYLGMCRIETGAIEEGERDVQRALQINPRFAYGDAHLYLARHYLKRGHFDDSRRWARDAVKLNTSNVEAWVVLAEAERNAGDAATARKAYEQAREAHRHLPAYLKFPNRRWLVAAKRGLRATS